MKVALLLIIILSYLSLSSQEIDPINFERIFSQGKTFTTPLKNGNIEPLRKVNPPKDAWLFSKLENYKQNLGSKNIVYGEIIMPSANKNSNLFSYNLFAYDTKKEFYYFVAIVSYKVSENKVIKDKSFLFTERKSLINWWKTTFSFYESNEKNKIPEKYIFNVCPPPPFKK